MYLGPGPATLLAASSVWEALASELDAAASGYQSVITSLADRSWRGPSSIAMARAVAPYLVWMRQTAAQCEHAARQATAAVAAYEAAFALTVPPPMVEANRVRLSTLVVTNLLGQNTPAIMATEAEYGEMWAQDATAMYAYAADSASACALAPFTPAPRTTSPGGQTRVSTPGASSTVGPAAQPAGLLSLTGKGVSHTVGAATSGLSGLAAGTTKGMSGGTAGLSSEVADLASDAAELGAEGGGIGIDLYGASLDLQGADSMVGAAGVGAAGGLGSLEDLTPVPALGAGATASLGQATSLGALSAPPSWAHAASVAPLPAIDGGSPARWGTTLPSSPTIAVSNLPLGGRVGGGSTGSARREGHRPQLIPRTPVVG